MYPYQGVSKILVFNKTKGSKLGYVKMANTFWSRFKGLMLQKDIEEGLILKFSSERGRRGSAIHMFFMRVPLDVIFTDSNKKVVDIVTLKPWDTYTPKNPVQYVIEMILGTINSSNTEIGDYLEFTCEEI
jgi:uncharacterized protein